MEPQLHEESLTAAFIKAGVAKGTKSAESTTAPPRTEEPLLHQAPSLAALIDAAVVKGTALSTPALPRTEDPLLLQTPTTAGCIDVVASGSSGSTLCFLTDGLPAEIRNMIYKLAFAPNHRESVNLFEPNPPSDSLLMAYHGIDNEARLLYEDAYKNYWKTTHFKAIRPSRTPSFVLKISDHDLDLIRHMSVYRDREIECRSHRAFCDSCVRQTLIDSRGMWKVEHELLGNGTRELLGFLVHTHETVDCGVPIRAFRSYRYRTTTLYRDEQEAKKAILKLKLEEVVSMSRQIRIMLSGGHDSFW